MKTNFLSYSKHPTKEVKIGKLCLGGTNPVRIQSMTNTDTSDVKATVEQIIKIIDAGADLVRITIPTSSVAKKIIPIKELLNKKGYTVPLIADIHFSPKAAEISAKYLEKVRINPGNYADLKQFKHIKYTDKEYKIEVDKIKANFIPLLNICKAYKTAIRIGTNHGSLSDRILSRYGDTPKGMVEATMEFLRICKEENFDAVVISMKASNPIVMIHAVRLLVDTMENENMYFPIHSGVTEAGNDEEGRIKSAIGIGTLLADGIGDTIRVSLTETPEKEIPVAEKIIKIFDSKRLSLYKPVFSINKTMFSPYRYSKRKTLQIGKIGGENVPVVISGIKGELTQNDILQCGYLKNEKTGLFEETERSADFLYVENSENIIKVPKNPKDITKKHNGNGIIFLPKPNVTEDSKTLTFCQIDVKNFQRHNYNSTANKKNIVYVLNLSDVSSPIHAARNFFFYLEEKNIQTPVIIKYKISEYNEYALLECSAISGALFIDGFGDGIWIESSDGSKIKEINELSFGILQAGRTRITKTDYISCPSCGRTLFDLEKTTAMIKKRTAHLKGLKIGIMGCIVNGPGEMADADFGYVGTGTGKITLYKKQEVIKRNIPEKAAVDELLKLIENNS